jgi:Fe-S-cluster containining protein
MRCSGQCCRILPLTFSPEKLKAAYDAKVNGEDGFTFEGNWYFELADVLTIYPMLRHVGHVEAGGKIPGRAITRACHLYACSHHQADGNCEIYQDRPAMCRAFPNGGACPYEGCTFSPMGCTEQGDE